MKKTLPILILSLLIGHRAFAFGPPAPNPPPSSSIPVVTVSTDKSVYSENEPIKITVKIENTSNEEIKEAYQMCNCVGYKMDGDKYPKNVVCCMAVGWNSLAAHSSAEKTYTHTDQLALGKHTIVGVYAPYESSSKEIEVRSATSPPPPSPTTGACCDTTTGICSVTSQTSCSASWLGDGVACDATTCPTPSTGPTATITDGPPFTNKIVDYYVDTTGYARGDEGIGLGVNIWGPKSFEMNIDRLDIIGSNGYIEIKEVPPYEDIYESNLPFYPIVASGSFFESESDVWFYIYPDKTLCQYPTARSYVAIVYDNYWNPYYSGILTISVAANTDNAIYSKTGAHVGDILYRDGPPLGFGHAAVYYGKDKEGNDLVIEANTITDACGESGSGPRITFARNSLDNNKWYGAFYPSGKTIDTDALIADGECQLGSPYTLLQTYYKANPCGNAGGLFRCDTFTQYLYENQGVDISVWPATSPYWQMQDSDLSKRTASSFSSQGVSALSVSSNCPDGSSTDSAGDPCNHNDCADYSSKDGVGDPCNHADCADGSLQDATGNSCNHNDCLDGSPRDGVGNSCNHNDCADRSPRDGVGDPCNHDDCADQSLRDLVGDSCNHNDCSDSSMQDSVGDPCIHNDCADRTLQDDIGDQCNHNDCSDRTPQDSVGDTCVHNDCADKSTQDSIGDPCVHNDCSDRSLEDSIGDPCNHDDCSDRTPRDTVGDPCVHNDCADRSTQDSIGDSCNHDDCSDRTPRDAVGDPCVHNDCTDMSLQDGVGDPCIHNDCTDRTPQDAIGDPCNHSDCTDLSPQDPIGDSCNHDEDGDGVVDASDACPNDPNDTIGNPCNHDEDGDKILDAVDTCPFDVHHDSVGNPCVHDEDGDGVPDGTDVFPFDATESVDVDGDGIGNNADTDNDNDGYSDKTEITEGSDPLDSTSTPQDNDHDLLPDSTDTDDDNDGVDDNHDVFPLDKTEWSDIDGDGIGDNTDENSWYDGFEMGDTSRWDLTVGPYNVNRLAAHYQSNGLEIKGGRTDETRLSKTLPIQANYLELKLWANIEELDKIIIGLGALDTFTILPDKVTHSLETTTHQIGRDEWVNIRLTWDTITGRFEFFENNWLILSTKWAAKNELISTFEIIVGQGTSAYLDDVSYFIDTDSDDDGTSNDVDTDYDNDGVANSEDAFKLDRLEWLDTDGDGIGNNADTDDDNDGILDGTDLYPLDTQESADFDGDGIGNNTDTDDDNDSIQDGEDSFQFSTSEWTDTDGDGIGNNSDADDDNDGVLDTQDAFSLAPNESNDVDLDSIGDNTDTDDDNDGVSDENELDIGLDPVDADSDDDAVADGNEPQPFEDTDGDGLINALDSDSDNDGITDGVEMGATQPAPIKGIVLGTTIGSSTIVIDQDPATITNPLSADTDGGGLLDGEEDLNFNGKIDPGELNPLDVSDDTLPTFFSGGRGGGCSLIKSSQETDYTATPLLLFAIPLLILIISVTLFNGKTSSMISGCQEIRSVIARRPEADVAIPRNQQVTWDCFVAPLLAMTKRGISKQILVMTIIICSFFVINPVSAQTTNVDGYNLQYFRPNTDGNGTFSVTGSSVLGHLKPHIGFYTNASRGLLAAGNPVNNQTVNIVDTFLTGDFVFGLGLGNFLDIGIDLPVSFFERGRDFNTTNTFNTSGIGDVRFDLKLRLLKDRSDSPSPLGGEGRGEGGNPLGIAFLSSVYFPSGEVSKFTGSKNVECEGRLIVDKKFTHIYLTANIGYKIVPQQTIANIDHDDELTFGAGAAIPLPVWKRSLELIGEVYGSTTVKDIKELTTPVEFLGGMRKTFDNDLALTVAGGTGLTSGAGSPTWRALIGVGYTFGKKSEKGEISNMQKAEPINRTIYFDFASAKIREGDIEMLTDVAKLLSADSNKKVRISGHTDSTGTRVYNQRLSEARAQAVKNSLITNNVNPDQMIVEASGEGKPAVSNTTRSGRAKNRRVEIQGAP